MPTCEMCGNNEATCLALVEGVELNVCKNCVSYGKKIKKPVVRTKKKIQIKRQQRELIQVIKENYSELIREKREKLGLKQQEFAKFLAEKESIIHKIESGSYKPSLELARKIERQLGLELVEQREIQPQNIKNTGKESFTIGDILKVK